MTQQLDEKLDILRTAIQETKQITGLGKDLPREFCPHILGRKNGRWHVLVWQFAGMSESILPDGGAWRCFDVRNLDQIACRDGDWYRGHTTGQRDQTCVDTIVDRDHGAEIQHTSNERTRWPAVRRQGLRRSR